MKKWGIGVLQLLLVAVAMQQTCRQWQRLMRLRRESLQRDFAICYRLLLLLLLSLLLLLLLYYYYHYCNCFLLLLLLFIFKVIQFCNAVVVQQIEANMVEA